MTKKRSKPKGILDAPEPDRYLNIYLSLGAGIESTAVYILAARNHDLVPRCDYALFADTGDEPEKTYAHLRQLETWGRTVGAPAIHRLEQPSGKSLSETMKTAWIPIPAYTLQPDGSIGILRRQCTNEAKVRLINAYARERLGLPKGRRAGDSERAMCIIGISRGEVHRAGESREEWKDHDYPLIRGMIDRREARLICESEGFHEIEKSACVYCPFKSDRQWADMARNRPEDFSRAVTLDNAIRHSARRHRITELELENQADGPTEKHPRNGITTDKIFVHRSCVPLDEIDFAAQPMLPCIEADPDQDTGTFGNECTGMCGV